MASDYFLLAFKNLKHRGIRSWLTTLGVLIGIAAVVALISLGAGLKTAVNAQFGVASTEVITIQAGGLNAYGPPGSGAENPLTVKDIEAIEKISTIDLVVRRNLPSGKLEYNDRVIFGYAANVPDGEKRKFVYDELNADILEGRLLKDGDTNKVVLGYNFYADKAGLGKSIEAGDKILLQDKRFTVIGIMEKTGSFINDNLVLVNDEPLKNLMGYGDNVDLIVVKVKDKDLIDKTKLEIEKELRKTRNVDEGEEDFEVTTPEASLETVNQILTGIQIFVIIIATISIIVGAIGIVNTMTTSVLERRKEIGIMKSVGARNSQIFMLFFFESGLIGLIGGIVGIILGVLAGMGGISALNNFLGATTAPQISFSLIFFALLGSFIIGSLAGIVPAMNAAKLNPVDAIRG